MKPNKHSTSKALLVRKLVANLFPVICFSFSRLERKPAGSSSRGALTVEGMWDRTRDVGTVPHSLVDKTSSLLEHDESPGQ